MNKQFSKFLDKFGTIFSFAVVWIIFCILSPHFRTGNNFVNILIQISPLLVSALGMTFVNMAGESDLSIGGTFGLCTTLFCLLLQKNINPFLSVLITIAASLVIGLLNGYLIAYRKMSSFIVTVGTMFIAMGIERTLNGGFSIWIRNDDVLEFSGGSTLGIPNLIIVSVVFFISVYFVLHQTKYGSHIQSVGENLETANLAGIAVKKLKFGTFLIASSFYAVGGILYALRGSGAICYAGQKVLLPVMAITFIGKTFLGYKRPNVIGIYIGTLILGAISNAFTLIGIEFYFTPIAQGIVLALAAAVSSANKDYILQEKLD
ncbi:MAG: ribose transport system permease protein [Kosmotogales bacterium]|nr:ribose transport system permease protein [Kosmotogales bacterium]